MEQRLNNVEKKKKQLKALERISLSSEATQNIDSWLEQLKSAVVTAKVTRGAVVNWLIESKGRMLSRNELTEIEERLFDPIKAIEVALAKAKVAAETGERVDISEIMSIICVRPKKKKRTRKDLSQNCLTKGIESQEVCTVSQKHSESIKDE
jgi:hypothetical protein